MRVEDLQTAHEQHGQRDDVDPVHEAHRQRVAVVEVPGRGWRLSVITAMVVTSGPRALTIPAMSAPYATLTPDRILDALDARRRARRRPPDRAQQLREPRLPRVIATTRLRSSSNSTAPAAGPTSRSSRSTPSSPSSRSARSRPSRRWRSPAATLHHDGDLRFAVYPRHGGRTPELDDPETLDLARPLHRAHPRRGRASAASRHRPALDIATFGDEPREFLLAHDFVPADLREAYDSVSQMALDGVRRLLRSRRTR